MGDGKRGAEWPAGTEQKTDDADTAWPGEPPDLGVDLAELEAAAREISAAKDEPEWMLHHRLDSLERFPDLPMPDWPGQPDLGPVDLGKVIPYVRPDVEPPTEGDGEGEDAGRSWRDLPESFRETYERLGIPDAERDALAGTGAQADSESIYHAIQERYADEGVIFCSMEAAVREHPDLVREYFMTAVTPDAHRFAALHGALWSGGSFVYVPENVTVDLPVHAYFWMGQPGSGQFAHKVIVAEKGAEVHYIEGCSAPRFNAVNLDAGAVEVFVGEDARVQHSKIQNWSRNTYALTSDRAIVEKGGHVDWIAGTLGSKVSMGYPASYLRGRGASANYVMVTVAESGQNLDTGAKVLFEAPDTSATVQAKSIAKGGGRTNFRGLVRALGDVRNATASVDCSALMFDTESISATMPSIEVEGEGVTVAHEASVGRIGVDEVFYLQTRGLDEGQAKGLIVSGFIDPITSELPLPYALELNRLVRLEMAGTLG
ncbi:MAG TPA: Fe-S cluster assembly protein SufB [Natrialbaceae archaeon]|nr:Fe-S cluster assembly protein SufB [Natrialbaceae archaeon]